MDRITLAVEVLVSPGEGASMVLEVFWEKTQISKGCREGLVEPSNQMSASRPPIAMTGNCTNWLVGHRCLKLGLMPKCEMARSSTK